MAWPVRLTHAVYEENRTLIWNRVADLVRCRLTGIGAKFIDFMLEPGNALRNQATTKFMPALKEATLRSAGWSQSTPISKDDRRRLYFLDQLSDEQSTALRDAWIKRQGL